MTWSRIDFEDGFESPGCQWVRTVFQSLYEFVDDDEFDALALYRDRKPSGVTLFMSPSATARLRAAVARFSLVDCERPEEHAVEIVIGAPLATSPAWCELSPAERLAVAEAAYGINLEVVEPAEEEVPPEAVGQ